MTDLDEPVDQSLLGSAMRLPPLWGSSTSSAQPWRGSAADWSRPGLWHSAAEDTPDQIFTLWRDAVGRSGYLVAEALADGGPERLARLTWPNGRAPSVRWIIVYMIEEYARHNGHADLLRESVDELTGE